MKYKVFLNNPKRPWMPNTKWLLLNGKFSMEYNPKQLVTWTNVHHYMLKKYGSAYDIAPGTEGSVNIQNDLMGDPLANETGNQTVAVGNQEVGQQALFTTT